MHLVLMPPEKSPECLKSPEIPLLRTFICLWWPWKQKVFLLLYDGFDKCSAEVPEAAHS